MNQPSSGFGILRALLLIAGGVIFLFLAFWAAIIVIGVALVAFLTRMVWRAVTGRGRDRDPVVETIVIQPGHRSAYDNGNVIVLPVTAEPSRR
ncbi:MAG: hypothetical protein ACOH19_15865 [Rhodoglobus sp.]